MRLEEVLYYIFENLDNTATAGYTIVLSNLWKKLFLNTLWNIEISIILIMSLIKNVGIFCARNYLILERYIKIILLWLFYYMLSKLFHESIKESDSNKSTISWDFVVWISPFSILPGIRADLFFTFFYFIYLVIYDQDYLVSLITLLLDL